MSTAELTCTVRDVADRVRAIDLAGELTATCDEQITAAHEQASAGGVEAVVLNFGDVAYMNSGGIGLLVTTLIRAQRSGHRLLAHNLSDHYRQIFALTRLDEVIEIVDDESAV